jgi:hypothetical protein
VNVGPGVGVAVLIGVEVGIGVAVAVGVGAGVGVGIGVGVGLEAGSVRVSVATAGTPIEPFNGLLRLTVSDLLGPTIGLFSSTTVIAFDAGSASAQESVPLVAT